MLVVKRRAGEAVRIGKDVVLSVLEIEGQRVTLGFDAPKTVIILRGELDEIARENEQASRPRERADLEDLLGGRKDR